jgi:hypothetical protein
MRASDSEVVDSLREVVLVMMLRNDDLGCSRLCGCRGGTGAAVVDDGSDPSEERLLVHLSDGQAVGFIVY